MGKKKSVGGRKAVKIRKAAPKKVAPIYNSDDDVPDEEAENYVNDDIDTYNDDLLQSSNDEYDDVVLGEPRRHEKEAVYDFSDSEEEEELENRLRKVEASVRKKQRLDVGSDSDDEAGMIDEKEWKARAWGKKRDDFYGADVRGNKVDVGISSDEDDEAEARLEEKEARLMQQKLLTEIDEQDFGLEMFTSGDSAPVDKEGGKAEGTEETQASVQTDVSKLSDKEKTRLLKKEYPEFINIVSDYRDQLLEYKDRVFPIIQLYKDKRLPSSNGVKLIQLKGQLLLDYCCSAQFYMLLRAEKSPVDGHPVIKRMVHFKQLLKQIADREQLFKSEIDFILKKIKENKTHEILPLTLNSSSVARPEDSVLEPDAESRGTTAPITFKAQPKKKVKKSAKNTTKQAKRMEELLDSEEESGDDDKRSEALPDVSLESDDGRFIDGLSETAGEREAAEFYSVIKQRKQNPTSTTDNDDDVVVAEGEDDATDMDKRAITEKMRKNRGLTVKRSKSLKNPRVKNKLKYQRKKKIHKTIVPQVLTEMKRYGGETSGIRAGRVRSIPLS